MIREVALPEGGADIEAWREELKAAQKAWQKKEGDLRAEQEWRLILTGLLAAGGAVEEWRLAPVLLGMAIGAAAGNVYWSFKTRAELKQQRGSIESSRQGLEKKVKQIMTAGVMTCVPEGVDEGEAIVRFDKGGVAVADSRMPIDAGLN